MKFFSTLSLILASSALTSNALLIPSDVKALATIEEKRDTTFLNDLFKRKGGGGGGKGGGSSSGSSSSGSSSSGSSSSGGSTSGSSGGSSGASAARGSSGSNVGGSTTTGSGAPRSYGGGRYYGGGATTPYTAGSRTPKGLLAVGFLGVGALAFFPGLWLYGAYLYPYSHPYNFYNGTARQNQTRPVKCLCQQYSVCGCDDNDDTSYLDGVIGNGSMAAMNQSLVRVANVNGTDTIFLNGTLPNGTTASGGTDSATATSAAGMKSVEITGWLVIGGAFAVAMSML